MSENKKQLHGLLERQLRRYLAGYPPLPHSLEPIAEAVSQAYTQADKDHELAERSIELTSREFAELNTKLKQELAEANAADQALRDQSKGMAKNVVELAEANRKIREAEERYQALFDSSRDAIMTLEPPTWNFTSGNPATIKMFACLSEKDFVSRGPWQYSPPKQPDGTPSLAKAKKMIMRAMGDGSNFFEWTHRTKGGKDFPATVLLTRMTTSGKTFLQATVRDITEQKRSEGALRASERNYKSLVDTATVGVFKTTLDGRILLANKALAGILGFASPEEVTRHKALDFYARKEDRVRFVRLLKAKGRVTDFEVELVRRDKSAARVWLSALVEGGAITGTVVDITERKEAEKQLKNYQLIVESAHDAIFLKDLKSRYVMANDNAARAFGFKRSQVIGKNDLELMKDKKEARKNIDDDQRVFKTRKPVECIKEMTDTKGGKRWFQAIKVPLFDEKGGVSGLVGIARDITKQKSAEQALRESEAGFSEFLNNVPDPVVVVDAVGTILYASKAMEELVGVKAKDFVGKSLVQAPTFDAATKAVMLKNVALRVTGAKIAPYLVYARDSEGRSLPVEVNARAVDLKGRRVVVVVFRDMSARFDLQHKLEASNKALREKTAEMANTIKEFAEANRGLTKSEEKVKQLEEQLRKKP